MSTSTVRGTTVRLDGLPRVNLLPPEIEAARRTRRVQVALGAGVVASAVVVGGLFVMATGQVHDAQSDLTAAKAKGTSLQAEQAKYADVPKVYAQVEARHAQLTQAMGQEIRWSYFLNDISLLTPGKVWLTQMTVVQNVDPVAANPAVATTPTFGTPGVATLTVQGAGYTHNDVAAWLRALGGEPGIADPYFTRSTQQVIGTDQAVTFDSQAVVTEDALSGRFSDKAGS